MPLRTDRRTVGRSYLDLLRGAASKNDRQVACPLATSWEPSLAVAVGVAVCVGVAVGVGVAPVAVAVGVACGPVAVFNATVSIAKSVQSPSQLVTPKTTLVMLAPLPSRTPINAASPLASLVTLNGPPSDVSPLKGWICAVN